MGSGGDLFVQTKVVVGLPFSGMDLWLWMSSFSARLEIRASRVVASRFPLKSLLIWARVSPCSPALRSASESLASSPLAARTGAWRSPRSSSPARWPRTSDGGGYLLGLLLSFFRDTVIPKLREEHPEEERRDLFSAAAEVAQLLGWTSYDAGWHRSARMYFIQGLRLAREADDRMAGGRLLSNLSHQANCLGQFGDALQYARAAHHAVIGVATPAVNAILLAMEARALANQGEAQACAAVMDRAEVSLDQSQPGVEPGWVSYVDANELAGEWAHCFRDLGQNAQAQRFADQALQGVPPRTQAFMRMVGAKSTFQDGNLDEAVSLANQAIDLAGPLDSARYHQYLTDFHANITRAYGREHLVDEFTNTLRQRYPSLSLVGDR